MRCIYTHTLIYRKPLRQQAIRISLRSRTLGMVHRRLPGSCATVRLSRNLSLKILPFVRPEMTRRPDSAHRWTMRSWWPTSTHWPMMATICPFPATRGPWATPPEERSPTPKSHHIGGDWSLKMDEQGVSCFILCGKMILRDSLLDELKRIGQLECYALKGTVR